MFLCHLNNDVILMSLHFIFQISICQKMALLIFISFMQGHSRGAGTPSMNQCLFSMSRIQRMETFWHIKALLPLKSIISHNVKADFHSRDLGMMCVSEHVPRKMALGWNLSKAFRKKKANPGSAGVCWTVAWRAVQETVCLPASLYLCP